MPNTKITKTKWKLHMQYAKRVYIILIVAGILAGSALFSMTAPQTANINKVDVYVVEANVKPEGLSDVAAQALLDGQAYEMKRDAENGVDTAAEDYAPMLKEVNIYSILFDEDNDDGYGGQAYMTRIMTMEGDIFIVTSGQFDGLVNMGAVLPLDGYIESGVIRPGDRDLNRATYPEYVDEDEEPTGRVCVYGLQCKPMADKLLEMGGFVADDMYMVIMNYCENPDTAAAVMQSMIDQLDSEAAE